MINTNKNTSRVVGKNKVLSAWNIKIGKTAFSITIIQCLAHGGNLYR